MTERVREQDVRLDDGRTVHVFDSSPADVVQPFTVVWHHGSPQTGALLAPLLEATGRRGIRLVSYGRPGYGGSTPRPGRDVASAAADVAQVADALGIERFAVMGASGGGPHALACGALLADRVTGVACLASIAPYSPDADWFAGMASDGGLRSALEGRDARAAYAATEEFHPDSFTGADWAALAGTWASLGEDAGRAGAAGTDGLVDDDVAFVSPWGFDLARGVAPVLLVQGGADRVVPLAHAHRLMGACPRPELWLRPADGHISVLDACPVALDWLRHNAA